MNFRILPAFVLAVLCLFCNLEIRAQEMHPVARQVQDLHDAGVSFQTFAPFIPAYKMYLPAEKAVRNAQYLSLDAAALQKLWTERPAFVQLQIPYNDNLLLVDLYEAPVLSANFDVRTSDNEATPHPYTPGAYYRGILHDDTGSIATLSCFENELIAIVSSAALGNVVVGRLDFPGNTNAYIAYQDANLLEKPAFECLEREAPGHHDVEGAEAQPEVSGCVEIYFECDNELYLNKGSVINTVNYVTGIFNQVSTLYTAEAVTVVISQIYVWTSADNYTNSSSSTALNEFRALRVNYNGDLAHLLSLGGNNVGGIAYLTVLCVPSYSYGYSNISSSYSNVPTYSWTIEVVTHELGHNLGSHHTHWCLWPGGPIDNCAPTAGIPNDDGPCTNGPTPTGGGTIMSYCHLTGNGINFSNGFGPLPRGAIQTGVTDAVTSNCIAANCTSYSCNPPTDIAATSIGATSATISWTTISGATAYNLQYRVVGASAWSTITSVTSPYALNGLNQGTEYEIQMQSVCGGSSSRYFVGIIFKTGYVGCAPVSNFTNSSNTSTSTTINWTENGTATAWQIEYGLRGFVQGTGTTANVSTRPHTVSGLSSSLSYDCYIRADCGGGTYSAWAGPFIMSTALDNDAPSGAILLTVNAACPGQNVYRNIGATFTTGEYNPTYPTNGYWGTSANATVWFKFVAPSSGCIKVTTDLAPQGSMSDGQIALYSVTTVSNFATYTHLVSNEDGGLTGNTYNPFLYYTGLTPGTTYYIQVDGWSVTGYFCIEVHETMEIDDPGTGCKSYTETVNGTTYPNKWFNFYSKPTQYDLGLPIAALKTTQNLGTVTVQATRASSVPTSPSGIKYMQRYLNFNASQNNSGSKQVRLLFSNSEFSALQSASGNFGTTDDLNITHYDGTSEDCSLANNSGGTYTLITTVSPTSIGSSGLFQLELSAPGFSEMGTHFGATALPIELIAFKGQTLQHSNSLYWKTAAEKDALRFDIERSINGTSDWYTLGSINAANSPTGAEYELEDRQPPLSAFYRLRSIQIDGTTQVSDIVSLERKGAPGVLTGLYPNPSAETLYVQFEAPEETDYTLRILDVAGRLVYDQTVHAGSGPNTQSIQVAALHPAVYVLEIKNERTSDRRYFVRH